MIELDVFTGLRRGELIGLRWQDVDFEQLVIHVRRSVVAMVEGAPKTEASQNDVPLDAQTAETLFAWRQTCAYSGPGDWVLASPVMKGSSRIGLGLRGGTTPSLLSATKATKNRIATPRCFINPRLNAVTQLKKTSYRN